MPVRWPRHPLLYEINTRVWLREISPAGRPATLATVPDDRLDAIAQHGFDAVWLMGVWAVGPEAVWAARHDPGLRPVYRRALPDCTDADIIGSPYAVSRYEVAEEIGGPGGLQLLRSRLAMRGMRLVLDFVGNHTARDHRLVHERPEAFVQGTSDDLARDSAAFFRTREGIVLAHGRDPYFPAWSDTAQVNHASAAGREAMLEILQRIADQCDGVRCDMAMLQLPDVFERTWAGRLGDNAVRGSFWAEAIPQALARHPRFLFIAEAYWGLEERLHGEGFHYTYDKTLYDLLKGGEAPGVRAHLRRPRGFQERCARFTENHDEERAAEAFGAAAPMAAVATYCAPGLRLLHEGQMEGRRVRVPVQLRRRLEEPVDDGLLDFYSRLLRVLQDRIFKDGVCRPVDVHQAGDHDYTNEDMVAFAWEHGRASEPRTFLVVSNLAGRQGYARVPLDPARYQEQRTYVLTDHVDGSCYTREGAEMLSPGLFVSLGPYQAHVLEIAPSSLAPPVE